MKKSFLDMNSMRRITKREFWLLAILMLALEGYLIYTYLLVPIWKDYSQKSVSYSNKLLVVDKLKLDYNNLNKFKDKEKEVNTKLEELESMVPSYVSQEEVINSIDKLAAEKMITVGSITFNKDKAVPMNNADAKAGQQQGQQTSSPEQQAVQPGSAVVEQIVGIELSGNYSSIYSFIDTMENSKRKIRISKIDLSRNETSILKGSLEIAFISYLDTSDNKKFLLDTKEIKGRADLFEPYEGYGTGKASSTASAQNVLTPNFYLMLNTNMDSAAKVIMAEFPKAETELYSNANDEVRCKLALTGSGNTFSYSYTVGSLTRSSTKAVELTNGSIRLDVISQERKSTDDKVAVVLDVDNKTGKPLDIKIVKDDKTKPRFKLGTKTGIVNVK